MEHKGLFHCFHLMEVWKSVCRDLKRKAEYVFHLAFPLSSLQRMRTRCLRCAIESCTIFDQKLQPAAFTSWQRSLWAWMIPEVSCDQSLHGSCWMEGFCLAEGRRWRLIEAVVNDTESLDQTPFQPHHHECCTILCSETLLPVITPDPLDFYSWLHVPLGLSAAVPRATSEFRWFVRPC